jgi:heavy metal translocating P-type ATPase
MLKGRFASDIVAMLAIIAAILLDQAFAGVVIVLMQSGGEAVEKYGLRRASSSLEELLVRAPRIATRRKEERLEEVNVKAVRVGDILVVRPGDLVPVDGTVVVGRAEIDEAALTGEPLPRTKTVGEQVLSGSVSVDGAFEMRADKVSEESQYAKIVELVRKAQEEKPPIQRLADRYAVWFTPITLVMATLGWVITRDLTTVLSVLVVATPCPLILATPIAVISGINRAAQDGIIVKGGAAIEQIGKAKVVVFDKTGTITYGTPNVERIIPINGRTTDDLLRKAASVGQLSSHPVALSLAHKGEQQFGKLPAPANFHEMPGRGIEGDLNGEHITVGSQRFLEDILGNSFKEQTAPVREEMHSEGKLVTFAAINGKPAGVVVFSDQIRPGVPAMVQRLRDLGVKQTVMLTGDNAENAHVIAMQAGITRVEANLLPAQKVSAIQKLKENYGSTVMVGDGINDAPALATATVGVAMGAHGTGISAEAADMVLLVDDVTKVTDGVAIGQRMLHIAKQSIYVGLGLSFAFMVIAIFGFIQPTIGAILQEIIDAAVILNALRAR